MSWLITAHRPATSEHVDTDADGRTWISECLTPGCLWSATGADPARLDFLSAHHAAICAPDPFRGNE